MTCPRSTIDPVPKFRCPPTAGFFPDPDGKREKALLHESVNLTLGEAHELLDLGPAKEGFDVRGSLHHGPNKTIMFVQSQEKV